MNDSMFCARCGGKIRSSALVIKTIFLILSLFSVLTYAYADETSNPPTLAGGRVIPENGAWGSVFTFEVIYTDNENNLPAAGYPRLCIDNETIELAERDSADVDVTDGKVYEYPWTPAKENVGTHKFYFYAEDSRDPPTGEYAGPTVTERLTFLTWEVVNPEPAIGESVTFSGCLRTGDDNLGVVGENLVLVELLFENDFSVGSSITDENGNFVFSLDAPSPGIHVYRIRFFGDNYYGTSESSRLYVSTLDEPLILGIVATVLLVVVGFLMFLLSRGMMKARYLKPVLLGSLLGIFLNFVGAGFLSFFAAGSVAGYLFAKETPGWTKHLRVGCMTGLLILPVLGIIFIYLIIEHPEHFLACSVTQADMLTFFLYQTTYSILLFCLLAGLAATIGGVLRRGLRPQAVERTEQPLAKP